MPKKINKGWFIKGDKRHKKTKEWREKMSLIFKGRKLSEEHKQKMRGGRPHTRGKNNYQWKGDRASKSAMHKWICRYKGMPRQCEICGDTNKKVYDWANKNHTYERNLDDYIRVCRICHRKYDIENNNYRNYAYG